jgi:glycosyltransferase involved in cell wall biosynthesis
MNIYIPNTSEQKIGGGFTFLNNFKAGMKKFYGCYFVNNWQNADLIFIFSVSTTDAGEIEDAAKAGKKIIFRVDNIPRKSRNKRGRVYDKIRRFGELANAIVYQSKWAMDYAGWLVGHPEKASIIYNGVDRDIFFPGVKDIHTGFIKYLFVHYNRDENKRFPEAAYLFHQAWRQNKKHELTIVGAFSPELVDAGFDFFAGEDVHYYPPVDDPKLLAQIYREHDVLLFPAFADACSNTVLEALACGLKVAGVNPVGGTVELLNLPDISLERMCREYDNLIKKITNYV